MDWPICRAPPTVLLQPSACLPLGLLQVLGCGLNVPAPDLMTPSKAASAIWTWAPGHPYDPIPTSGSEDGSSGSSSSGSAKPAAAATESHPGLGLEGPAAGRRLSQTAVGDGEVSWGVRLDIEALLSPLLRF